MFGIELFFLAILVMFVGVIILVITSIMKASKTPGLTVVVIGAVMLLVSFALCSTGYGGNI